MVQHRVDGAGVRVRGPEGLELRSEGVVVGVFALQLHAQHGADLAVLSHPH